MQRVGRRSGQSAGMLVALASLPLLMGCSKPGQVSVSPQAAAEQAIRLYDANRDGAINVEEAASCPPLASLIRSYDADGDSQLRTDEIANRLRQLYSSSSTLTEVTVTAKLDGQAISGAIVRLRPVDFLADAIPPAEAETDVAGVAHPTIGDARLPSDFRGLRLVQHGLYFVEITHPSRKLAERYNSASVLGFEVDSTSREGTTARFELTR